MTAPTKIITTSFWNSIRPVTPVLKSGSNFKAITRKKSDTDDNLSLSSYESDPAYASHSNSENITDGQTQATDQAYESDVKVRTKQSVEQTSHKKIFRLKTGPTAGSPPPRPANYSEIDVKIRELKQKIPLLEHELCRKNLKLKLLFLALQRLDISLEAKIETMTWREYAEQALENKKSELTQLRAEFKDTTAYKNKLESRSIIKLFGTFFGCCSPTSSKNTDKVKETSYRFQHSPSGIVPKR